MGWCRCAAMTALVFVGACALGRQASASGPEEARQEKGPEPYRARAGRGDLYIPTFFHAQTGDAQPTYDLVVHFHGIARAQEVNIEAARVNCIMMRDSAEETCRRLPSLAGGQAPPKQTPCARLSRGR